MTTGGMPTPKLARIREAVSAADGIIAVSPVFTVRYSGLFKMFVDTLDTDALNGMPAIVAATAGTHTIRWCSITPSGLYSPICVPLSHQQGFLPQPKISLTTRMAGI